VKPRLTTSSYARRREMRVRVIGYFALAVVVLLASAALSIVEAS